MSGQPVVSPRTSLRTARPIVSARGLRTAAVLCGSALRLVAGLQTARLTLRFVDSFRIGAPVLAIAACLIASLAGAPAATAADEHAASTALAGLEVAPGLEATLFASEPMLLSPTNIDVDHLGRVWVCEVVNYRHRDGSRPAGDRILILEDTDGDGKADKSTVFYQGRDIDSAMGICVLGNRVVVSVSPNVFVFTDTDGDGKADKKDVLFARTGQPQHDHSAHAFLFGPDGRLYWNFGNEGKSVNDAAGKPVLDRFGRAVVDDGNPYRGGMAFRCDADDSNFEVLSHNFRNNYEVAVDSFGGLWQSDNDDDGNRSVRINFLLEYGNYGYRDEMTGAGWQSPRTNLEREVPQRHWHQNDPGVVPNLLVTGAGSPTGIVVYEGSLLPPIFRNQVIHCDAGPRVVRAYVVENDGAGYRARVVDILNGARDTWFRPSDVCVAPDGSLIVADWYDPGVGGHRMGDVERGRIFRIAPPRTPYRSPKYDLSTGAGAVSALQSPNLAARYLAWTALVSKGNEAEASLLRLYQDSENPRMRARALWLLGRFPARASRYVARAAAEKDPNLRMTALRLARRNRQDVAETVNGLVRDPSPQVRRECAIALRNVNGPRKASLWTELAVQYDGRDRWYLEALGIGADGDWDACLDAWMKKVGPQWKSAAGCDIVWRSRAARTSKLLAALLVDPSTSPADALRYLRAFDFQRGPERQEALSRLAFANPRPDSDIRRLVVAEAIERLDPKTVIENPAHLEALNRIVEAVGGTPRFVALVERFNLRGHAPQLLSIAQSNAENDLGVRAVRVLLGQGGDRTIDAALALGDPKQVETTIRALATSEDPRAGRFLMVVIDDVKRPLDVRRQAVRALARTQPGSSALLARAEAGTLAAGLRDAASAALHGSQSEEIRDRAAKLFPLPPAVDSRPLPPIKQLAKRTGDPRKGRIVFATVGTCAKCHVVNSEGKEVGPNLSDVGAKLGRAAIYESILFPSAGISHNFATYTLVLASGNVVSGILTSRTSESISIRGIDAVTRTYAASEVEEIQEQSVSLMPADLQKLMTIDDLVDVVEYMTTLKTGNGVAGDRSKGDQRAAGR